MSAGAKIRACRFPVADRQRTAAEPLEQRDRRRSAVCELEGKPLRHETREGRDQLQRALGRGEDRQVALSDMTVLVHQQGPGEVVSRAAHRGDQALVPGLAESDLPRWAELHDGDAVGTLAVSQLRDPCPADVVLPVVRVVLVARAEESRGDRPGLDVHAHRGEQAEVPHPDEHPVGAPGHRGEDKPVLVERAGVGGVDQQDVRRLPAHDGWPDGPLATIAG